MVKIGVYQNRNARSAIVIQVKQGIVTYLTNAPGDNYTIFLLQHSAERFNDEWPKHLPQYPITRAARIFNTSPYKATDGAARILRHLLEM